MSKQQGEQWPSFFVWIAADSSSVLGWGRTADMAYRSAAQRHPPAHGYPAQVTVSHFPLEGAQANPLQAMTGAFRVANPSREELPPPPRRRKARPKLQPKAEEAAKASTAEASS